MDALRDWGHAKDYVKMQWLMLQQESPEDFVIATGEQHTVRQFVLWAAAELGIELAFQGEGCHEIGVVSSVSGDKAPVLQVGDVIVRVDSRYFRPAEVETLLGDPTRAKQKLGWEPETTVRALCSEMVAHDLILARQQVLLKTHGYGVNTNADYAA
jgi:GDPmannose 4,6-dehydratase